MEVGMLRGDRPSSCTLQHGARTAKRAGAPLRLSPTLAPAARALDWMAVHPGEAALALAVGRLFVIPLAYVLNVGLASRKEWG